MNDDEFDDLVSLVRRQWGHHLPVPSRDETSDELATREERTRMVLEREVLGELAQQRDRERLARLTPAEEDRLVDAVVAGTLGLHRIFDHLRRPLVEEIRVSGSGPLTTLSADGSRQQYPALVRRPRDLERVIYEIASARHRPFNHSSPFVDVSLGDGVRFHGAGFDVVGEPFFTIRRPVAMGRTLADLQSGGTIDEGLYDLLVAAIAAELSIVVVGPMASGKTTLLRSLALEIPADRLVATIETDFELALGRLGHFEQVLEYQARLSTTTADRGISTEEFIAPVLRSRADWIIVGEIRAGEARAFTEAVGVARGVLVTVHGTSCAAGLNRISRLLAQAMAGQLNLASAQHVIFGLVDLVVRMDGDAGRGRWVAELVAPYALDQDRVGWHTLYNTLTGAPDERARPASPPQEWLELRLRDADTGWTPRAWQQRHDTYAPVRALGERPLRSA